jgi:hypothetical protein
MNDEENLLDHQWDQLQKEEREQEEWWEAQDSDETWIQKMLRLLKEEGKRWI